MKRAGASNRDLRRLQPGFLDQESDTVRSNRGEGGVGRRVVAMRDHRFQHGNGLGGPRQVQENGAYERPDAVVDRELLVLREPPRLDLPQISGQDERLDGAADEETPIGLVRLCPGIGGVLRRDQATGGHGQRGKSRNRRSHPGRVAVRTILRARPPSECGSRRDRAGEGEQSAAMEIHICKDSTGRVDMGRKTACSLGDER
jgi:hypothetical protein